MSSRRTLDQLQEAYRRMGLTPDGVNPEPPSIEDVEHLLAVVRSQHPTTATTSTTSSNDEQPIDPVAIAREALMRGMRR